MEIARILEGRGLQHKETGTGQLVVRDCPFCQDTKGKADNLWKLYISKESGLFLCHRCQSRGNADQLAEKLGVLVADDSRFKLVDQYLYQAEDGCTYLRVTRLEDGLGNKSFYQEILENGVWIKGGARKALQPFRFVEWEHEHSIVVVEGEKCVVVARSIGLAATTFVGGCNGWKESYASYFRGKHVILLPDQDEPGFKFVSRVAVAIAKVAASYKVVLLPGLADKDDLCDWIRKGGDAQRFSGLCGNTPEGNLSVLQIQAPQGEQVWGEVKPLPSTHAPVHDISPDIVPDVLRIWVSDIADRMQVPLICVAALALTVVGSLIGRKARVYPKRADDWYEVANLWSMIIMPSGRLKSPIINAVLKPLQELSDAADKEFQALSSKMEFERAVLEAKIQAAKKDIQKIATARTPNRDEKLARAQSELMTLQIHQEESPARNRRYKIHDATVEKIGELLKSNPNGLLLVRDELAGWLSSLDRVGHEGDRAFFLEAWNGKGSYDVDRISRGTLHIDALCLSVLGGIPPSRLESYVEGAVSGGAGNDGLLQRFGLMVHADFKKDWRLIDRSPDKPAYERVKNAFLSLDSLSFQGQPWDGEVAEGGQLCVRFDQQAQELFYEWLTRLETDIRAEENECDAFVSHISKYRKLVPSLALQFFLLKKVDDPAVGVNIDGASLKAAIDWARYLENHARWVYSLALNPQIHAARSLAQKIKQDKVADGARLRDIYRHQWSNLKTRAAVDMAIAVLSECNWLVIEEVRPATGAPFEILRLNPAMLDSNLVNKLRDGPGYKLDRTDTSAGGTYVSSVNQLSTWEEGA